MTQLAIQMLGKGPPLVLLHGWGFDSQIWETLIPDLSESYQIFLVDLPGFGRSPTMSWEIFKQVLLAALPRQFMVMGWSLGGLFATKLAREAPERIYQLIQVTSSPYFIQQEDWPGIAHNVLEDFYEKFVSSPQNTRQQFVQAQLPQDTAWLPETQSGLNISGLEAGLATLKYWDLRKDLMQLKMPVAYLFGRLDRIVPYRTMTSLQAICPHFHYTLLPQSGHMPFLSHRGVFMRWLKEVA